MRKTAWTVVGVFLVLTLANVSGAQTLTGTIIGKVTDEGNLPMPGVTVTLTSPQMIKSVEVRNTNELGEYRAPALPPGRYQLKFELTGFKTVVRDGIALPAGDTRAVDVVLQVAAVEETVTVAGASPMIDVSSAKISSTVTNEMLENLPIQRNYSAILNTVPGVQSGSPSGTGSYVVLGSSSVTNFYGLDGLNISDSYSNSPVLFLPQDIFQEVQVTTGAFSAEFGNVEGGVFNFITKSGGNRFSGDTSFYLQDQSMQSENVDDALRAQGLQQGSATTRLTDISGSLGGPILRDRIWFFAAGRKYDTKNQIPSFTAGTQEVYHRPFYTKGTYQISSSNKIEGGYEYRYGKYFPENAGFHTNDDPRTWRRWNHAEHTVVFNYTSILSDTTFVTARIGSMRHTRYGEFPNSDDRTGAREVSSGVTCCGWITLQGEQWRRGTRANASLTHFVNRGFGSHQLKTGLDMEFNYDGRDSIWPEDMFHLFQNTLPYRIELYNTPRLDADNNVTVYSGFLQDEWAMSRRVTVNAGVRVDHNEAWLPEQSSPAGKWFEATSYEELRNLTNTLTVSPRVGIVWDLRGDRRTTVKASMGRYYGSQRLNQVPNPNESGAQTWTWIDRNGDRYFQAGEQGVLISDTRGGSAFSKTDPNLKTPHTDAFTIGVEHELWPQFAVSLTGVYKRGREFGSQVSENIPITAYDAITTPNPLNSDPITFYILKEQFRGIRNVALLTNPTDPDERSRYYGVEMTARKRLSNRWQLQASLNMSRAEDNFVQGVVDVWSSLAAPTAGGGNRSNPNSLSHAMGRAYTDRPVVLKIHGTYQAPFDIALSGSFISQSGLPWARLLRFYRADFPQMVVETFVDARGEPIGTQRLDWVQTLDLRAEKVITMPYGGHRLGLIADVYNLFNANTVVDYNSTRVDSPFYATAKRILSPRTLQLGIRYSF